MMPDLPLRIEHVPSSNSAFRVIKLEGPLTLSNFFEFQNMVRADSATSLIVDLTGVPYIDSAGIGALVNGYVSHQHAGRTLSLVGVVDRVRTTMGVAHVDKFFPMYQSVAEAEQKAAAAK